MIQVCHPRKRSKFHPQTKRVGSKNSWKLAIGTNPQSYVSPPFPRNNPLFMISLKNTPITHNQHKQHPASWNPAPLSVLFPSVNPHLLHKVLVTPMVRLAAESAVPMTSDEDSSDEGIHHGYHWTITFQVKIVKWSRNYHDYRRIPMLF